MVTVFIKLLAEERQSSRVHDLNCAGYPAKASKTVPAYRLLIAGEANMILVPYASADVLEEAENAGVELEFHKVAAEALLFITPAENPTESITLEQIREIYLHYGITN
jgi:phosphate transport system substrate-binding protein